MNSNSKFKGAALSRPRGHRPVPSVRRPAVSESPARPPAGPIPKFIRYKLVTAAESVNSDPAPLELDSTNRVYTDIMQKLHGPGSQSGLQLLTTDFVTRKGAVHEHHDIKSAELEALQGAGWDYTEISRKFPNDFATNEELEVQVKSGPGTMMESVHSKQYVKTMIKNTQAVMKDKTIEA